MPELCTRVDGEAVCMPVDLTVFDDPRRPLVEEEPGETGAPQTTMPSPARPARVRTLVAEGALPDGWPRGDRVPGELVKGHDRVPCEVEIRAEATTAGADESSGGSDDQGRLEVVLFGDDVYRAILGRAP